VRDEKFLYGWSYWSNRCDWAAAHFVAVTATLAAITLLALTFA
jgi:hypothetical protein